MRIQQLSIARSRSSGGVGTSDFLSEPIIGKGAESSQNLSTQLLLSSENGQLEVCQFPYQVFRCFSEKTEKSCITAPNGVLFAGHLNLLKLQMDLSPRILGRFQ